MAYRSPSSDHGPWGPAPSAYPAAKRFPWGPLLVGIFFFPVGLIWPLVLFVQAMKEGPAKRRYNAIAVFCFVAALIVGVWVAAALLATPDPDSPFYFSEYESVDFHTPVAVAMFAGALGAAVVFWVCGWFAPPHAVELPEWLRWSVRIVTFLIPFVCLLIWAALAIQQGETPAPKADYERKVATVHWVSFLSSCACVVTFVRLRKADPAPSAWEDWSGADRGARHPPPDPDRNAALRSRLFGYFMAIVNSLIAAFIASKLFHW